MKHAYDFSTGKRGAVVRVPATKTRIPLWLDDDVVEWFRAEVHQMGGGSYQALINQRLAGVCATSTRAVGENLAARHSRRIATCLTPKSRVDGRASVNAKCGWVCQRHGAVRANPGIKADWRSAPGMHASVVAGREFNPKTGECEYLIKNSWGRGAKYDSSLRAEEGYVWMPKSYLSEGLQSVTTFED